VTADTPFTEEQIGSLTNALTLNAWSFMNGLNRWANSLPENQQALWNLVLSGRRQSGELSPEALDNKTFEELAKQLAEFAKGWDPPHQQIVMVVVRRLLDPIERLKLRSPSGEFSEEEETILRDLERGSGRP
jgi:hypothetical protein